MLTELCQEIRNWFERGIFPGTITIRNNAFTFDDGKDPGLLTGQYYRIVGSVFSDGIHQYGSEKQGELADETFTGAIWALAIPKEVVALADEINAWRVKYDNADSAALSPFQSESFGGYSYSKGGGASTGGSGADWTGIFKKRLNTWRKILP